jgi:hypothetical protein
MTRDLADVQRELAIQFKRIAQLQLISMTCAAVAEVAYDVIVCSRVQGLRHPGARLATARRLAVPPTRGGTAMPDLPTSDANRLLRFALLLVAQAERKLDAAERFMRAATEHADRAQVESRAAAGRSTSVRRHRNEG